MGKTITTPPRSSSSTLYPITPTSLPRTSTVNQQNNREQCEKRADTLVDNNRNIRSLPKRQRLASASDEKDTFPLVGLNNRSSHSPSLEGFQVEEELEVIEEIDAFPPPSGEKEVSKEFRIDSCSHQHITSNHPPWKNPPLPTCSTCSILESNSEDESRLPSTPVSLLSTSTSTSTSTDSTPTSSFASFASSTSSKDDEKIDHPPGYFPLFGEEGEKLVRSLASASNFSSTGLFGGLGLAPVTERDQGGRDEEEEDEECYVTGGEREQGNNREVRILDVDFQLGNNKKKRKIPGVVRGPTEDDDRAVEREDEIAEVPLFDPIQKAPAIQRSDFATGLIPKSSSPLPTTAKAALAKLRPPHISIAFSVLSHRRFDRRFHKRYVALQKPLKLPRPSIFYSAPTSFSFGPPPLPPGSGLKGSKALKVAMKVEKEREKERERIKLALGGGKIKLFNFWDPLGTIASVNRLSRRTGADVKSGYITPPASSDEGDASSPPTERLSLPSLVPTLDSFEFTSTPTFLIESRWLSLSNQIVRVKLAKERAIKAREEERKRRLEKEKENMVTLKGEGKKSSPTTSRRAPLPASAGSRPPVQPSIESSPPLHINDFPSPPPTRKPPLKGKKKRSAHANANNPHFINNFVPSRAPVASTSHHTLNPHHDSMSLPLTWPASEEAMASLAEVKTKLRSGAGGGDGGGAGYFAGSDEWLCAFCDYEIFYGEESQLAKMVVQRKKVLRRKRKAKERAAKATGGEVPE